MALTIDQLADLGGLDATNEIRDTVDNLLNSPLFDVPILGPLLRELLQGVIGGGEAVITAVVDGTSGLAALTDLDIADLGDLGAILDPGADSVIPLSMAEALLEAGIGFVETVSITVQDTAENFGNLSPSGIGDLADIGIDILDAGGDVVSMTLDQVSALVNANMVLSSLGVGVLVDTALNIASMTIEGILALLSAGIQIIDVSDDDAVYLTVAQAKAFAQSDVVFSSDDVVIIRDTGDQIGALSVSEINDIAAVGIDSIDASDNAVALSLVKIAALTAADIALTGSDTVTVADTAANLSGLTTLQIADLGGKGVDAIDSTDDFLTLNLAQFNALGGAAISLADGDVVTLAEAGATLSELTTSEIANLADKGIDIVDATDNAVVLTAEQAKAFAAAGIAFGESDTVKLADSGANIAALNASEIADLGAAGIGLIDAIDDVVSVAVVQAKAFATAGIAFVSADAVKIEDTGANIAAIAAGEVAALKTAGIDTIDASDNAVSILVVQASAFATAGIAFAAGDDVKVADIGANIAALTTSEIAALGAAGVDAIDATNNTVTIGVGQAIAFIDAGIDFAGGDMVRLSDTGTNIATLTAGDIADLKTAGADAVDATDNAVSVTGAQAKAFATAGFVFVDGDVAVLADTGAHIAALSTDDLAALKAAGIDMVDALDNTVSLSAAQYKALGSIDFAANDVISVWGNNQRDNMKAGDNDVTLEGRNGKDKLFGGTDDSTLAGGKGRDIMTGGAGNDDFLFDTKLGSSNVDKIKSYNVAHDQIELDDAIFTAIGNNLTKDEFFKGGKAHDRSDHIIYDKAEGALYYDHDGKGDDAAVKFATVQAGTKLTLADFDIV